MGTVEEVTSFRPKNLPAIWAAVSYTMEECGQGRVHGYPSAGFFPLHPWPGGQQGRSRGTHKYLEAKALFTSREQRQTSLCKYSQQLSEVIPIGGLLGKKPAAKEGRRWELETSSCFQEGSCWAEVGTQDKLPSLPRGRSASRERKVMEVVKIQFRTLYQ